MLDGVMLMTKEGSLLRRNMGLKQPILKMSLREMMLKE